MTKALNALTTVAYVVETTENTTPDDPVFQTIRASNENLTVDVGHQFSGELDGRLGQKNHAQVSKAGGGGFDFEYSDGLLEDFFESVLRGAWATDVLVNGTTPKSFSLETRFEAGTTDVFKRLTGAQVNTLSLSLRASEVITGSVGFLARNAGFANAIVTGATYTAGSAEKVEVGATVGNVALAGLTLDCTPQIDLNINANLAGERGLGAFGFCSLAPGELEVTGSISTHLTATQYAVLQAYENGTATGLSFDIGATTGKKLSVDMPVVYLESVNVVSASRDGSVMIESGFRALQATSLSGGVIELTRNV